MKKIILLFILFFLTINLCYSQNTNEYKIDKSIKINFISLKIIHPSVYKKNGEKTLIGISISRNNDSISQLQKIYDKEDDTKPKGLTYLEEVNWGSIKISTKTFDKIINLIKEIDIKSVNNSYKNSNIFDRSFHQLSFSGEGYQINSTVKSPEINTKERGLEEFLTVSNEIWKLIEL